MSRRFIFWSVIIITLLCLFLPKSVFGNAYCTGDNPCVYPLVKDPAYVQNMIRVLENKGTYWEIGANSTASFNADFGDFTQNEGFQVVNGIVGGGACDIASMINHTLNRDGRLQTEIDDPNHDPVPGVPNGYQVVIYDYVGQGPSGKDLRVINPLPYPVRLHWKIEASQISFWLEEQSRKAKSSDTNITIRQEEIVNAEPSTQRPFTESIELVKSISFVRHKILVIILGMALVVLCACLIYSRKLRGAFFYSLGVITLISIVLAVYLFSIPSREIPTVWAQNGTSTDPESAVVIPLEKEETTAEEITISLVKDPPPPEQNQKLGTEGCEVLKNFAPNVNRWCDLIIHYANQNGVDPTLIAAIITQESGGDPNAYSHSGAVGLMQVMPQDGISAGFMCQNGPCFADRPTIAQLKDPEFNISYGSKMISDLIRRFGGSERDALKAYGPMDYGYQYADIVLGIRSKNK